MSDNSGPLLPIPSRRHSLSHSSTSGRNLIEDVAWPPGQAKVNFKEFGPIPVQLAVRYLYIKDAETVVQTFDRCKKAEDKDGYVIADAADVGGASQGKAPDDDASQKKAIPAFTCRFSVHTRWPDRYYKYTEAELAGKDDDDIVHYSTHPKIGNRAVNFPEWDKSVHGEDILTDRCPRWTPEINFFDAMEPPQMIRCEYFADRKKGEVACFYEAKGTFFGTRKTLEGGKTQELVMRLGTQHRTGKMRFVPYPTEHLREGIRADFTVGEFDFKTRAVRHKLPTGGWADDHSAEESKLIATSNRMADAVKRLSENGVDMAQLKEAEAEQALAALDAADTAAGKESSEKFATLTAEDIKKCANLRYISVVESQAPGYHMACFKVTADIFKQKAWHVRQAMKADKLRQNHIFRRVPRPVAQVVCFCIVCVKDAHRLGMLAPVGKSILTAAAAWAVKCLTFRGEPDLSTKV